MRVEIRLTTIAMKWMDNSWSIDTYARTYKGSNDKFIDKWMEQYSGNGIERAKVIENQDTVIYCDTFSDLEKIGKKILEINPKVNTTILDY